VSAESIDLLKLWQMLRRERDRAQADYDNKSAAMTAKHKAKKSVAFLDRAVFDEENQSLKTAMENLKDSERLLAQFEKEHPSVPY
jgi:hypothetical protein